MLVVSKGIMDKFSATDGGGAHNAFWLSVAGKLFNGQAPQGTTAPYVVLETPSDEPEYMIAPNQFEILDIQFSIYSDNRSVVEVETIFNNLIALYDDAALTISGWTVIKFERGIANVFPDEAGRWQKVVEYNLLINKN